ncbi:alpha-L-rhamnosidase N-terminal domain-containing protein [Pedobacter sp. UC225_61]|uniref:alpha-L-rhamnosidase-related protein n=1 Tax=Pedobacter sp. UC225_61 TaxID=3374623 RepID=UPI0037BD28A6
MKKTVWLLMVFFYTSAGMLMAQQAAIAPALLSGPWKASWISCPGAMQREYGVYHFRKSFSLSSMPSSFVVNVTADNRYRLFVNGKAVVSGSAHGDLFSWFFETVDIAPFLQSGDNVIAATVWNMGEHMPAAQVSSQTGLLLQGNGKVEEVVNTDSTWKVTQDNSYSAVSLDNRERLKAYMVVGPGDRIDGKHYPWGWEQTGFDDSRWKNARELSVPYPMGYGTGNAWTLVPRNIPLFSEKRVDFSRMFASDGSDIESTTFLRDKLAIHIQPNQKIKVLFDNKVNCVAYPELLMSGGKGASVKISYAEALVDSLGVKGNRNELSGKHLIGNYDIFLPDGGSRRLFRPLWLRAYRFVELEITTADEPLVLEDFYGMATGYPLELNASFSCSDSSLSEIWKVGWRTAQLCAGDMYYDTPYYEQLQYVGDSRIQALISLYCSGDDRLMRKALLDFYRSRTPIGLTQSRYPTNRLQIIPTFSLFWVSMVHDYWMHRRDDEFVRQFLPAINEVLMWYKDRIDKKTGMLGPMQWWNFIDWDNFNGWGIAPGAEDGNSAIISLQAAYTFSQGSELFSAFGKAGEAKEFIGISNGLKKATYGLCFDSSRGLFADLPGKTSYSQHASIWGVLSGTVSGSEAKWVMERVLSDKSIGQATFFYRFYLSQALKKAGMADLYYAQLQPWRNMLALGLTTFSEKPEPTRSDCHAWSASPNYDFLSTICGIMPSSPGFRSVRIAPALGELDWVKGSMPHPDGKVSMELKKGVDGKGLSGFVELPKELKGEFWWKGKSIRLTGGRQEIRL